MYYVLHTLTNKPIGEYMNKTKLITNRKLSSVWTIEYEEVKGGAYLHLYSRDDERGYQQEDNLPQGYLIENNGKHSSECNGDRIVTAICINEETGETLDVVNPDHVFSYE